MVKGNMVACVECGKRLGFFEGHYHPTLGKKSLLCYSCFVKVEESVARWQDFILSNSFNPEASEIRKQINRIEQVKNPQIIQNKSRSEMALNYLNYHKPSTN
jgi:hypothetical protein